MAMVVQKETRLEGSTTNLTIILIQFKVILALTEFNYLLTEVSS